MTGELGETAAAVDAGGFPEDVETEIVRGAATRTLWLSLRLLISSSGWYSFGIWLNVASEDSSWNGQLRIRQVVFVVVVAVVVSEPVPARAPAAAALAVPAAVLVAGPGVPAPIAVLVPAPGPALILLPLMIRPPVGETGMVGAAGVEVGTEEDLLNMRVSTSHFQV